MHFDVFSFRHHVFKIEKTGSAIFPAEPVVIREASIHIL